MNEASPFESSYSGTFLATVDITNKMASVASQGIVFPC